MNTEINTYYKFAPNVFVAKTKGVFQKGDTITLTTKRGKENECFIHNLVGVSRANPEYRYYSITRVDGFNSQEWAKRKAEKNKGYAANAAAKSDQYYDASNKDREFLSLGEPIKVGHHSEKRHRKIIQQAWDNMGRSVSFRDKSLTYEDKAEYYESISSKIDLSLPESIDYYEFKLEEAKQLHQDYKSGERKREHSFSLTYAKKAVNELTKKVKLAQLLWA